MKAIIALFIFCIVLFTYLHVTFQLRTSDDLEVYEIDNISKNRLEEVCDIRQPVLIDYYNEHISDFSYHNFLLDQAIIIKNNYNNFNLSNNWENNADFLTNTIYPYLDKIINHNDISRNQLYNYLNYDPDFSLNLGGKYMNKIDINNEFLKLNKNKINNEAQKINNNFDFTKNSLIYTILAILLIISIILVVLYKLFPNYLNEFTLLVYFISIIFIVFFIHVLT